MKKIKIILKQGDSLNSNFKNLINELIEVSGEDSVIDRKDNRDLWDEIVEGSKEYWIISTFTKEEIEMMDGLSYVKVEEI